MKPNIFQQVEASGTDKAYSEPMAHIGHNMENSGISFGFFQVGFLFWQKAVFKSLLYDLVAASLTLM